MRARLIIAILLAIILGVPFLMTAGARDAQEADPGTPQLIIVTPHVPQIRAEFARAFSAWHLEAYGEPIAVDWRTPGGTSEIRKQLSAMFDSAAKSLASRGTITAEDDDSVMLPAGSIDYDLFFGGGSFDHGQAARPMSIPVTGRDGNPFTARVRQPYRPTLHRMNWTPCLVPTRSDPSSSMTRTSAGSGPRFRASASSTTATASSGSACPSLLRSVIWAIPG